MTTSMKQKFLTAEEMTFDECYLLVDLRCQEIAKPGFIQMLINNQLTVIKNIKKFADKKLMQKRLKITERHLAFLNHANPCK
jgi:hypothetical protein